MLDLSQAVTLKKNQIGKKNHPVSLYKDSYSLNSFFFLFHSLWRSYHVLEYVFLKFYLVWKMFVIQRASETFLMFQIL